MSFFAIVFALMLEQVRPMPLINTAHDLAFGWVRACARSLDAGRTHHGWLIWSCTVLLPACAAWLIYAILHMTGGWVGAVLAFGWSVGVLYCTLGFRQFSHHFSAIRQAVDDGDIETATQRLADWKQIDKGQIAPAQLTQMLMEHGVLAAHRHVFAVLGWYAVYAALGFGPAGAVLYRMAEFVSRYFQRVSMSSPSSQLAAQAAWYWVDYVPARATAMAFAIVGSFEDVVDAWRNRLVASPPLSNDGLILLAMAASLALQGPAQPAHVSSLVGLVWRSVVLWLLLIALLTLARLLG